MSTRPNTASNGRVRVPPGGYTSVVFDDYAAPVQDKRISYSISTINTFSQFDSPKSPFSRPAKKGLGRNQGSMKDILEYSPYSPRRNENRPPPGGKTTIQLA